MSRHMSGLIELSWRSTLVPRDVTCWHGISCQRAQGCASRPLYRSGVNRALCGGHYRSGVSRALCGGHSTAAVWTGRCVVGTLPQRCEQGVVWRTLYRSGVNRALCGGHSTEAVWTGRCVAATLPKRCEQGVVWRTLYRSGVNRALCGGHSTCGVAEPSSSGDGEDAHLLAHHRLPRCALSLAVPEQLGATGGGKHKYSTRTAWSNTRGKTRIQQEAPGLY